MRRRMRILWGRGLPSSASQLTLSRLWQTSYIP